MGQRWVGDGGKDGLTWGLGQQQGRKIDRLASRQGSWDCEEWRKKEKINKREKRRVVAWVSSKEEEGGLGLGKEMGRSAIGQVRWVSKVEEQRKISKERG
nr:hypothetical protein CFP56_19072 [Quercus suber]